MPPQREVEWGVLTPFSEKAWPRSHKELSWYHINISYSKDFLHKDTKQDKTEINPLRRENQNCFNAKRPKSRQIVTFGHIPEGMNSKSLLATLFFIEFSNLFDSVHQEKMKDILLIYGKPWETLDGIMTIYQYTRSMVHSTDGDTNIFDITVVVL